MKREVYGISFNWALVFFLLALFLLPVLLMADFVQTNIKAEKENIARAFFAEMERAYTPKRQEMVRILNKPVLDITKLAQDPLLEKQDRNRFSQVAEEAMKDPFVSGVGLVAWTGEKIYSVGKFHLDAFSELIRLGKETFLVTNIGYGARTGSASDTPFLCLSMSIQDQRMALMKKWYSLIESDKENRLFGLVKNPETQKWTFYPFSPKDERPATFVQPLELPPDFNPEAAQDRSRIVDSLDGPVGVFADPMSPGNFFILLKSAKEVKEKYDHYVNGMLFRLFISLFYTLFLGILFSSLLGTPIRKLSEACDQIESGNYNIFAARSIFSELDRFGQTFQRVATRVGNRIEAANNELMEQHGRLKALFEGVGEAIYLMDSQNSVILANTLARKKMNVSEIGPEGFQLDDTRRALIEKILQESGDRSVQFKDPMENTWNKLHLRPLTDYSGKMLGYVIVESDITLEREIDRMKSEFVSNVSHELRTPLTSIQAYAEMLVDEEVENKEKEREYLGIILIETERLTRLINDVLDLSRIETGRQIIRKKPIRIDEIARHSVQIMEKWATKKNLEMVVQIQELEKNIMADKDMIEQLMLNLLSNAIKYTQAGKIDVSLTFSPEMVRFSVKDTGIGMTPGERDKLFSKFFRAENELVKQAGGTGLGLVLVREICRLHEGEISVTTELNKGSCFTFSLPMSTFEQPDSSKK